MNVFLYLGRFEGNRITYQDVGQMDMYLQMYDKMKKGPDDNPTIGIILCTETDSDEIGRASCRERVFVHV